MSKLKKIGERITHKQHDDCYTIVISPTIEKWEMGLLIFWVFAWTFCGLALTYYLMFEMHSAKEIMVFGVLLVFWIYFELRAVRAFLWRKHGLEIIKIDKEKLSIKDSIFKHGKARDFFFTEFTKDDIESIYINPKSYSKVMNDSFWQVGQGTIALDYLNKKVYFGTQLENKDSDKLAKLIKKKVEFYQTESQSVDT